MFVDIDGALTQDGGAVFNEASADVDFRVESNGNTHMLFVDAGNDRVGVGISSPTTTLDVAGSVRLKTGATGTPVIVSTGGDSQGTLRFGSSGNEYSINSGADYVAMIFNTNGAERMRIDSSGNVGIGQALLFSNFLALVLELKGGIGVERWQPLKTVQAQEYQVSLMHDWLTIFLSGESSNFLDQPVLRLKLASTERMRILIQWHAPRRQNG